MLPLATLMLASQAIPTAINIGKAITQGSQAKKLAKTPRPVYELPEAVKQQVNQARYLASMKELPNQNIMEGRIGENLSKGISELKNVSSNPSDLASNIAKMYSGSNDSINDIGLQAGQQWLQNQSLLNNNLGTLGQYQDKQFDINQMQPYKNNMAASSALREGAFRNLAAAGQNIASGIGGAANMQYQQNQLDALTGMGGDNGSGLGSVTQGLIDQSITGIPQNQFGGNDNNFGNQIATQQPKMQTMTEAVQNPIINPINVGVGTNKQQYSQDDLLKLLMNFKNRPQ